MSETFKIPPSARAKGSSPLAPDPTAEQGEGADARRASSPANCCAFCGNEISTRNAYRRVRGWERRRRKGGTNALTLREPLDEWACVPCIELARSGLTGQQEIA